MDISIPVSARQSAIALGLVTLMLVATSIAASFLSFVQIDDPFLGEVRESLVRLAWVDGEGNIPAWYSASMLLLCALLLATIADAQRHRREYVGHWLLLALIFVFLSADETVQIHELSIQPLRDLFNTSGLLFYAWIIPAGVCLVLLALGYARFLAKLPATTRRQFVLAAALFVGGAIGVEAVSGMHAAVHGEQNLIYHLIITVEELFEMAGVVVFAYALLHYISRQFTNLGFHVVPRA